MKELYLVFSTRSNSHSWYSEYQLRGVYDQENIVKLKQKFLEQAKENVLNNERSNILVKPCADNPQMESDEARQSMILELSAEIKKMQKQTNEYRLSGDFDQFIETNDMIAQKKGELKKLQSYDKSVKAYKRWLESRKSGNPTFESLVQDEYQKLISRIQIVKIHTDDSYLDEINIHVYRSSVVHVEKVTFDSDLRFDEYPPYISFLKACEHGQQKHLDSMDSATKHYNAHKGVLDKKREEGVDVESADFKKTFKNTTNAYYLLRNKEHEYIKFLQNIPKEADKLLQQFRANCFTINAELNTEFSNDVSLHPSVFNIHDVRRFGDRVVLDDITM